MFDPTSRYFNIENATLSVMDEDGTLRSIVYKRRRFVPSAEDDDRCGGAYGDARRAAR